VVELYVQINIAPACFVIDARTKQARTHTLLTQLGKDDVLQSL